MRNIISSTYGSLHLDTELSEAWDREYEALFKKFYQEQTKRYGIWAGNQGKFVQTEMEMNDWDSKFELRRYL